MRSRIRFYNRQGYPLGEIAATTKRSWLLNNFGECTFIINKRNQKLTKELIEFGNIILVTNPHTKAWVGVIDTPRVWTTKGPRVTAYSAEILFSYRDNLSVNPDTNFLNTQTTLNGKAGLIFQQILNIANETEDTLMRAGSIFLDRADRQETLSTDLLTHIRNVAQRSGHDFDVIPAMQDNNMLLLSANWYVSKGMPNNVVLEEGVNIELKDETLIEQGRIVNSVVGIGVAELDAPSIGAIFKNNESALRYGTRQGSITYGTVSEVATLKDNVTVYTDANSYPRATANITCVDSGIFKNINEGDTVKLVLHSAGFLASNIIGFSENVRVLAMQANDNRSTLDLVLDEIAGGV